MSCPHWSWLVIQSFDSFGLHCGSLSLVCSDFCLSNCPWQPFGSRTLNWICEKHFEHIHWKVLTIQFADCYPELRQQPCAPSTKREKGREQPPILLKLIPKDSVHGSSQLVPMHWLHYPVQECFGTYNSPQGTVQCFLSAVLLHLSSSIRIHPYQSAFISSS